MTILKDLFELTKHNSKRKTVDVLGKDLFYDFKWNEGVSISEIDRFEQENGISIPSQYKEFLTNSNGADIFVCDDGNSGYHLFSLDELFSETKWIKEAYDLQSNDLVFMEPLFSPNFMMFSGNDHQKIVFGDTGEQNDDWVRLSMDFNYFILRLYWSNGSSFWEWYY